MQARDDWQSVLVRPGLCVFTGVRRGVNRVTPLHGSRGVILGALFRRSAMGASVPSDTTLSFDEQVEILHSHGQALVDRYWGRYVAFLPIADLGDCVIRDPSGALPCYRLQHQGVSIVFSWLEDVLLRFPGVPIPAVQWDALAAHIALVSVSGRETPLEGVAQVLPGERASLVAIGQSTLLWNAAAFADAPVHDDLQSAAINLRKIVRGTVQTWASCYDRILLRLSGGLDSAIVLSCLDRGDVRTEVTCLNYHSPGSDSDERPFARLAAVHARRPLIEQERESTCSLEQVLRVARTPMPGSYLGRLHTSHVDAAQARRLRASAMFTGGAGDQLFFEFKTWWGAADYLRVRGLDGGFLEAAMDAARLSHRSIWRVLGLALRERFARSTPPEEADSHLTLTNRDAMPSITHRHCYMHPALAEVNALPIGKRMHLQQLLYPIDYYDPYALEAAPEIVHPLLSQPVIECCLTIPTYQLTDGGQGRALARRAFAGDLPLEIIRRRSKGGMEEHVNDLLDRNIDFARGLLLDGHLVRHGILDRSKLATALSGRPTALAGRTGELHAYLGIEAWLQRMSS